MNNPDGGRASHSSVAVGLGHSSTGTALSYRVYIAFASLSDPEPTQPRFTITLEYSDAQPALGREGDFDGGAMYEIYC